MVHELNYQAGVVAVDEAPVEIVPRAVRVRAAAVSVIVAVAALLVLREAKAFIVPVLASILCAYALEPAVAMLRRWGVPRPLAAIIIYMLLAVAAIGAAQAARTRVTRFVDTLPTLIAEFRASATPDAGDAPGPLDHLQQTAKTIQQTAAEYAPPAAPGVRRVTLVEPRFDIRAYLTSASVGLARLGVQVVAIAVMTFLLLVAGDVWRQKLVTIAGPRRADKRVTMDVINSIDRQIERYLIVRVLICGIVAVATGVPIALMGVDNAAVLGLLAGVLNVVPYIGPASGIVMVTLATYLQFKTIAITAAAGGAALAVAVLEGNFVTPLLMSRAGELNTVAVFVSVLVFGWLWDVWGLLLAVPIMVAVKAAADHIESLRPVGELLGR
jgi:predicted PurR-regulated permease PerM